MPSSAFQTCRSEEHTSELQSHSHLVCRLLLEKKTTPAEPMVKSSPAGSAEWTSTNQIAAGRTDVELPPGSPGGMERHHSDSVQRFFLMDPDPPGCHLLPRRGALHV